MRTGREKIKEGREKETQNFGLWSKNFNLGGPISSAI